MVSPVKSHIVDNKVLISKRTDKAQFDFSKLLTMFYLSYLYDDILYSTYVKYSVTFNPKNHCCHYSSLLNCEALLAFNGMLITGSDELPEYPRIYKTLWNVT